jgi:hypothetical protein
MGGWYYWAGFKHPPRGLNDHKPFVLFRFHSDYPLYQLNNKAHNNCYDWGNIWLFQIQIFYVYILIPYTMLGFYQYLNLSCDGFCHKIDSEMKNYQLKCAPAIVTG